MATIESKIRTINSRLANYEKRGLTNLQGYKALVSSIKQSGLVVTESKQGGYIRLSKGASAIQKVNLDVLNKIYEKGGLMQELQKVDKSKGRSREEKIHYLNNKSRLQDWLDENMDEVYFNQGNADTGLNAAANEVITMMRSGAKNEGYDAIFATIDNYIKAKAEKEEKEKEALGGIDLKSLIKKDGWFA